MVGASFFRSGEGKCPNCGTFAETLEEERQGFDDGQKCPNCQTVFNQFLIVEPGQDVEFKNN
ncbi:MAG: hypothetical protein SVU32_03800 [Candidatus Nanohaloarchaea archaeon]|nr:hypothetical protein [Candidatus Nanohaloarchaea archaeon]